ncbi:MAG: S1 RNA-binding domain-containing protein, partial [Bdellovibrionota bacterium]
MTENNGSANKAKAKAKVQREKLLAALDQEDASIPSNPSLFPMDNKNSESFETLFSATEEKGAFKVGEVVSGRVVEVQDDYVLVDINYKSEGLIPIS